MPAEPAIGSFLQSAANLPVQAVALPWLHCDVTRERVEQCEITIRVVCHLPVVVVDRDHLEESASFDLGPVLGERARLGPPRALRKPFADLLVDLLKVTKERVTT